MRMFNLSSHNIKEAMGEVWQQSRENYVWWDYNDIMNGDETWSEWVGRERSLSDVLREASHFRSRKNYEIAYRFGLRVQEVSKLFKTFIGYHPMHGAYICSVGPYLGLIGEAQNKFGFFIKRLRTASQDEVMDSVRKNIENYMDAFGVDLDPSDLQLVVRAKASGWDPERWSPPKTPEGKPQDRQRTSIRQVVTSLDPESNESKSFYEMSPVITSGSTFGPNAKGLEKIMRQLGGDFYEQVVAEKAQEQGISPQEVVQREISDLDFVQEVYKAVRQKYTQAVARGEDIALGMTPPPVFSKLSLQGKSGQVKFTTIKNVSKMLKRELVAQQEVLEVLNAGVTNPRQVQETLNADVRRKKNLLTIEDVEEIMERINEQAAEEGKDYGQMLTETTQHSSDLDNYYGFNDLGTTFEMAKLYFTQLPIDPKTKGKRQRRMAPRIAFDPPENFEDFSGADLSRLAEEARQRRERGEVFDPATEGEIEEQIGELPDTPEEAESEIEVEDLTPQEEEEEETPTMPSAVEDIFGNTLGNLIKIAEELDADGKNGASEEIHKVIRKYQGRIK